MNFSKKLNKLKIKKRIEKQETEMKENMG